MLISGRMVRVFLLQQRDVPTHVMDEILRRLDTHCSHQRDCAVFTLELMLDRVLGEDEELRSAACNFEWSGIESSVDRRAFAHHAGALAHQPVPPETSA